jgi:hypothetical protein
MKRILYVANALKPNGGRLAFTLYICRLAGAGLKALFYTDHETYSGELTWVNDVARHAGIVVNEDTGTLKEELCRRHMHEFKTICGQEGIVCTVHKATENLRDEVLLESRYTDLVLLDIALAYTPGNISIPTSLAEEILRSAECPVIALPETFSKIDEVVITYDGKISSMYAIKQFTYLFPALKDVRVSVISVNPEIVTADERYKFLEWMHNSYSNINFFAVEGDERKGLLEILLQHKDAIILMGAYGRSRFSTYIHPSHADNVLKMSSQPVFIGHP